MIQIIRDRENFNDTPSMFIIHTSDGDPSQNKILEDKPSCGH